MFSTVRAIRTVSSNYKYGAQTAVVIRVEECADRAARIRIQSRASLATGPARARWRLTTAAASHRAAGADHYQARQEIEAA